MHITAMVGKNATFSLQKHRPGSGLPDESVQRGHRSPIDHLNSAREVVSMNTTQSAARGYGFHQPFCISGSGNLGYLIQRKAVTVSRAAALARPDPTIACSEDSPRTPVISDVGRDRVGGVKVPLADERIREEKKQRT